MSHDDVLKPMGTQSADSVQVEAAQRAARERDEAGDTQRTGDSRKVAADMATQLVKDDPIKAMLVAAAAGALLMGLVVALAMD